MQAIKWPNICSTLTALNATVFAELHFENEKKNSYMEVRIYL